MIVGVVRYLYSVWTNGDVHEARRGVDFDLNVEQFRAVLTSHAHARGLRIVSRKVDGDTLRFRFLAGGAEVGEATRLALRMRIEDCDRVERYRRQQQDLVAAAEHLRGREQGALDAANAAIASLDGHLCQRTTSAAQEFSAHAEACLRYAEDLGHYLERLGEGPPATGAGDGG